MDKHRTAIIAAAGAGARFARGQNKLLAEVGGLPVLARCLLAFQSAPSVTEIVLTAPPEKCDDYARLAADFQINKLSAVVAGGETRAHSVKNGLDASSPKAELIAIHDAARCLVSHSLIDQGFEKAHRYGAAIPVLEPPDTVKQVRQDGAIFGTISRRNIRLAQTPQCFWASIIKEAYQQSTEVLQAATDDAQLVENIGYSVQTFAGEPRNIKITWPEDLQLASHFLKIDSATVQLAMNQSESPKTPGIVRVGTGVDIHPLEPGRKLILGGQEIPYDRGLAGHSDGDALTHAVCDALLGAAGLGDIGGHFPPSDAAYAGINSLLLLEKCAEMVASAGWRVANVDVAVMLQEPKIMRFVGAMKTHLARAMGIAAEQVSIKATTTERLGFVGRQEGIWCQAVALLEARDGKK